jgi:hypothetical protein
MNRELLYAQIERGVAAIRLSRLDVIAFAAAFVAGLVVYVVVHVLLRAPQWIVSAMIVGVMVLYAGSVWFVPRLRVRTDQAGDNAYYLGLLFTLMSMSFALYEFGGAVAADVSPARERAGAQQIIGNFGIALASTIAGIFLRVFMHQMRVDPADVESTTRIELSEASTRVRASLDAVAQDLALFHEEIKQRTTDVVAGIIADGRRALDSLNQVVELTTNDMFGAVASAHKKVLEQTDELTRRLAETATEMLSAIERLRAVEPPPLTVLRRLDRVGKALEVVGDQTDRVVSSFEESARTSATTVAELARVPAVLEQVADDMRESHRETLEKIASTVDTVNSALASVGDRLERDRSILAQLEEQSRRSAQEAARAQEASIEVLVRLTELARGLTQVFRDREATDGRNERFR